MANPIPEGLTAAAVVDFDIFSPPGADADYYAAWQSLQGRGEDGLVWTTANGGHWIATRGDVVRALWTDTARLSNEVLAVTPGLGETMRLIPLQQDGEEHRQFRNAIAKGFGGRHIVALEDSVVALADELTAAVAGQGGCDFMPAIAEVLPVHVFLSVIGVPPEDRAILRPLGAQLTRPDGTMTVVQLRDAVDDYLRPYVTARLAEPGEDLLSRILAQPVGGRPWTLDEAMRMARNILFAGLDTVAAMIGMIAFHLARTPGDQQALRDTPDLIPAAADELMRRYPVASVSRNAVVEVTIGDTTIRAGDIVYLPSVLHNLDPESFADPERVDFARGLNPMHHTTFGAGAHRCVGVGLARMEVIAFLRSWLAGIPPFRIDPAGTVAMRAGNVGILASLPLRW